MYIYVTCQDGWVGKRIDHFHYLNPAYRCMRIAYELFDIIIGVIE